MVDLPARQNSVRVKRKKRYKRKPYKPIDKNDFKEARLISRLTIEQTAKLLQVTSRTVALWECGATRIPYSAFKLLRCLAKGELIPEAWKGWTIRDDTLYSPSGRSFRVYELNYLANYLTMARYWQADYLQKVQARQVAKSGQPLRVVAGRGFNQVKP
jgi:DNA-binding transcriptional regulator YiaG